jgi:hypothetical protein
VNETNEPAQLDQLVIEIRFYSQQTALNMIEIGKRLLQAKKQVEHGEWGKWLKNKVDLSERTAQYFMKSYEIFGNTQNVAVFRPSQVYALIDASEPVRQEILENHKPEDMTGKQIKELSRQLLAAEQKAADMERCYKNTSNELQQARTKAAAVENIESDNETLRAANHQLETKLKSAGDPIIVEQPVQVTPPDYERIKSELAALRAKQAGITPERLEVVDKNCKEYAEQQKEKDKISKIIWEAITAPHSIPHENVEYAVQCYLDNSPAAGIDEVLWDVNLSITELTQLKQVLEDNKKLKVIKS